MANNITDNIVIRNMKASETPFLEEMLYDALYVPEGEPAFERTIIYSPEIYKYIKEWGRPYDIALLAVKENMLVGTIWGRLFHSTEKSYGFISENIPEISMAVKSEFRNQGIGHSLIESIKTEYLTLGFKALSLSVDKKNKALNLYLRTGFEIVEENGTAWTMRKVIV